MFPSHPPGEWSPGFSRFRPGDVAKLTFDVIKRVTLGSVSSQKSVPLYHQSNGLHSMCFTPKASLARYLEVDWV